MPRYASSSGGTSRGAPHCSSGSVNRKESLTLHDIDSALVALDAEVGKSELLMSVAPLRLICAGGCVAVKYFGVRGNTKDIDCLLDPNVDVAKDYHDALYAAIQKVANNQRLQHDWMNDEMRLFILDDKKMDLFLLSVEQNIVLHAGANIVVYAALMEWSLERKLRRVERAGRQARKEDISDAVAIIHLMKGNGPPLDAKHLAALNFNGFEMPMNNEFKMVKEEYEMIYRQVGIAEMVWDEEHQRNRYIGLDKKWHFA